MNTTEKHLYFLVNEDDDTIISVCNTYDEAVAKLKEEAEYYVTGCGECVTYSIIKGKRKKFLATCDVSIEEEAEDEE